VGDRGLCEGVGGLEGAQAGHGQLSETRNAERKTQNAKTQDTLTLCLRGRVSEWRPGSEQEAQQLDRQRGDSGAAAPAAGGGGHGGWWALDVCGLAERPGLCARAGSAWSGVAGLLVVGWLAGSLAGR